MWNGQTSCVSLDMLSTPTSLTQSTLDMDNRFAQAPELARDQRLNEPKPPIRAAAT